MPCCGYGSERGRENPCPPGARGTRYKTINCILHNILESGMRCGEKYSRKGGWGVRVVCNFNKVDKGVLTEKVTFELRPSGGEAIKLT